MMLYMGIKHLHLLTVAISIALFVLRFFWKCRNSSMLQKRWVKITPHLNDTVLLISGIVLIYITHFYPFSPQGTWLTEKLFGVLLYIGLGHIALSKRDKKPVVRWCAFIAALFCLALVIKLAMTKLAFFMGYV